MCGLWNSLKRGKGALLIVMVSVGICLLAAAFSILPSRFIKAGATVFLQTSQTITPTMYSPPLLDKVDQTSGTSLNHSVESEFAITTATGNQIVPDIAFNPDDDQYLTVWQDQRYNVDPWYDPGDIYIHRIDANGSLIGGEVNLTGVGTLEQANPQVAFDPYSNQYLVVWQEEVSPTNRNILAQRLDPTLGLVGGVITVQATSLFEQNPVVAANAADSGFLVVFESCSSDPEFRTCELLARQVYWNGSVSSVINISTGTGDRRHPAIAYNSWQDDYLVVWEQYFSTNDWDIKGQRIDWNGSLIGSNITIEAPGGMQTMPDIAYNFFNNEYMVVWEDQWGGASSDWYIKAWRLNGSGAQIQWYMISSNGTNRRMNPSIAFADGASEFLIAYDYEYNASDIDTYYSRIKADGTLRQVDAIIINTSNNERHPAIVSNYDQTYMAVWEDSRNSASTGIDIYSDFIDAYLFYGRVYQGSPGDYSTPINGVSLGLFCSDTPGAWGTYLEGGITDTEGYFQVGYHGSCPYYNIGEYNPSGYVSTGAQAASGGSFVSPDWIQFAWPLAGKQLGPNYFWDALPTSTPTSTRTSTPTGINTFTPTATRTNTFTPTNTVYYTPTFTATSTSTLTPTATTSYTPTATNTIHVTSTPTSTITSTPTPTATNTAVITPAPAVITFEEGIVQPDLIRSQYCNNVPMNKGVEFIGNNRIFKPNLTVFSQPYALTNSYPGDEFGSLNKLEFRYTAPQSNIELYIGLDRSYSFPVTATLYTYSSPNPGTGFVAYNTLYLGYGPSPITNKLQLYAGSGNILSARLEFSGMNPGQGAYEVIDSLKIFNPGPPCITDNSTPSVSIYDPVPGETILTAMTDLNFTAQDPDTGIAKVRLSLVDSGDSTITSFYMCGGAYAPACPSPSYVYNTNVTTLLEPGTAKIKVEAWDFTNKKGEAVQNINYIETGPNMNLWALGIEITQAIQPWLPTTLYQSRLGGSVPPTFSYPSSPNAVPIVADRTTVVRLFPGVEGTGSVVVKGARAYLYCYVNVAYSVPCPGYYYLSPVNGSISVDPADNLTARRDDLNKSWNFVLPKSWTMAGTIYLEGRVEPPYGVPECSGGCYDAANRIRISGITFNPVPNISQSVLHQVLINRVLDGTPMPPPNQADINKAVDFMRKIFPANESTISYSQDATWTLNDSASMELKERCDRIGGMLQNAFPNNAGKRAVFAYIDALYPCAGVGWPSGYAYGRSNADETTPAHETGHALGMKHAGPPPGDYVECTAAAGGCDDDYPYPHGTTGAYGFDVFAMKVIVPGILTSSPHDVMSYGHLDSTWWISPRNYIRFYNGFTGANLPFPSNPPGSSIETAISAEPAAALLVEGYQVEEGGWDLLPVFQTNMPGGDWQLPGEGEYRLQLRDAGDQVLFERRFDPLGGHIDMDFQDVVYAAPLSFGEIIPLQENTAKIVLMLGDEELASLTRSPNAPEVSLLSPTDAGFAGQPEHPVIEWVATDANDDPLVYIVQYSPDGLDAENWQTLASNIDQTELEVNLDELQGSTTAVVRVLASDGFNTAQVISPVFVVEPKPPQVSILAPADLTVIQEGMPIALRGAGWDREDGTLSDASLWWSSNISGDLGTGSGIDLAGLQPGNHTITLSAEDSQGLTASISISIEVEDLPNHQPVAEAGPDRIGETCSPLLNGKQSFDLDSDDLVYLWSVVEQPEGSQVRLTSPESALTYLVGDLPGIYMLQLIVHDRQVASAPDLVTITVTGDQLGVCTYMPYIRR